MDKRWQIFLNDAREVEKYLTPGSIQCVITSPPFYGLRDYKTEGSVWNGNEGCKHQWENRGYFKKYCNVCEAWNGNLGLEPTPDMYCEHIVEIFRHVRNVMRDDGVMFINLGDCYYNGKVAGGCVDADKLDRDEDKWAKLQNADPKNKARRFGRRPIDCPIPGLKKKDLIGIPWRCALSLQADGWYLRDAIIWAKAVVDADGNLEGSAMPGPQKDRCTPAYEFVFQFSKNPRYYFDLNGERTTSNATLRNVWKIYTKRTSKDYKHFATYPLELVERCVRLSTKENDIVLDPFMGTATTALACLDLSRKFIGFDVSKEYYELAQQRISNHQSE